jgi:hypothetical protein
LAANFAKLPDLQLASVRLAIRYAGTGHVSDRTIGQECSVAQYREPLGDRFDLTKSRSCSIRSRPIRCSRISASNTSPALTRSAGLRTSSRLVKKDARRLDGKRDAQFEPPALAVPERAGVFAKPFPQPAEFQIPNRLRRQRRTAVRRNADGQ